MATINTIPQAIFIIKGYAKSSLQVKRWIKAASRNANGIVLDHQGLPVEDDSDRYYVFDLWEMSFPDRSNGRYAMKCVISAPEDSYVKAFEDASVEFAKTNFSSYDYIVSITPNQKRPSATIICARRNNGPILDFNISDITKIRQSWANIGTNHNIPMIATSRF